jgi:hypothetical protein
LPQSEGRDVGRQKDEKAKRRDHVLISPLRRPAIFSSGHYANCVTAKFATS